MSQRVFESLLSGKYLNVAMILECAVRVVCYTLTRIMLRTYTQTKIATQRLRILSGIRALRCGVWLQFWVALAGAIFIANFRHPCFGCTGLVRTALYAVAPSLFVSLLASSTLYPLSAPWSASAVSNFLIEGRPTTYGRLFPWSRSALLLSFSHISPPS